MGDAGRGCTLGSFADYREAIERSVDPALFLRVAQEIPGEGLMPASVPSGGGQQIDGRARDVAFVRGMRAATTLLVSMGHSEDYRLAFLHRLMSAREVLVHPELVTHIAVGHRLSPVLLAAMATTPCRMDEERPGFELEELLRQVEHLAGEKRTE